MQFGWNRGKGMIRISSHSFAALALVSRFWIPCTRTDTATSRSFFCSSFQGFPGNLMGTSTSKGVRASLSAEADSDLMIAVAAACLS
ncbi:hypothetical protein BJ170DRAFT_641567 [Xylariales sp. AK1849]|nr:hypothetical protein BJ170DRAFT_641567 [Xylariales sp. AK1849]